MEDLAERAYENEADPWDEEDFKNTQLSLMWLDFLLERNVA